MKKIAWVFKQQTEFFLISWLLAVAKGFSVLNLIQHRKVVLDGFLLKRYRIFSFVVSLWTFKYFYCHCIYDYVKNINVLSFKVTKKFFSLFSLTNFSFKICNHCRTFFERGGNSIKRKYIDGGTSRLLEGLIGGPCI